MDERRTGSLYRGYIEEEILSELRIASKVASLLYTPATRRMLFTRKGQQAAETMTDIITGKTTYRQIFTALGSTVKLFS